jgi:hypothetical protein
MVANNPANPDTIIDMRVLTLTLVFALVLARAADSDLAGTFAGEWKSKGDSGGGAYRITLQQTGGTWTADVGFNVAGEDITAAVKEVKVTGTKLELTYTFETQGIALAGKAAGELKGPVFAGTYQSLIAEGDMLIDEGTWTATRAK